VGVKWINNSCMTCGFCTSAEETLCTKASFTGYMVDGTFAEYCAVQAASVARLPDSILPLKPDVAPIMCAGITSYRSLKESGAKPGQTVAIVGAGGGLGCLALQYAKAMGLRSIAIDTGDEKRKTCLEMGADVFIDFMDPGQEGVVEAVKKTTVDGMGVYAALVFAVGEKPFEQASQYVRPKGTVVCIGVPAGAQVSTSIFDMVIRMITIKGSYFGNRLESIEALDFFARGLIKVPHKVVGLSELPSVFEKLEKGEVVGRYVLDTSK